MSNQPDHEQADDERELTTGALGPFERLTRGADGRQNIEFDSRAHEAWLAKWVKCCPDGKPQRVREALGFRKRGVGYA
jgi:hypothetical protein